MRRAIAWTARTPPALRFGLKLATALSLAIWIAFAFALPWGLTIWIAVLFVAQPNAGGSIKKGVMRVAGAVAAGLVSIAIYGLFAQMPPLFLASLCGVLGVSVYGMTGTRFPYAWLVLGFTTILILVKALAGIDEIETLAFERASLDALGIFLLFVADAVFWPVRAERELREGLARRSRQLGETLRQLLDPRSTDPASSQPGSLPVSPLIQQLQLVDEARDEIGATPGGERALSRLALLLEGLASRVRLLARAAERPRRAPDPSARAALAQLGDAAKAALEETSRALLEAREPRRFSDGLDRGLIELHGWRAAEAEGDRSALVPFLRDVVASLRSVEDALVELARRADGSRVSRVSQATLAAIRKPPRVDPMRLQLALRAAIAGGGVIVLMLAMGWSPEADILPMCLAPILAFLLAGAVPTRGAGKQAGPGLVAGILLGWLIADLATVYLFPHLQRMPLVLVYPFVLATGAGYLVVRGSPLGPLGARFGLLTAILPVFLGDAAPRSVEAAYDLVCGELLGVAVGLTVQRVFWPRTAMETFTARVAGQLESCERAVTSPGRTDEETASLVSAYAKQLSLLGQLHAQAHSEPVERALGDQRRSDLLALVQDLFDASLRAPRWGIRDEVTASMEAVDELAPLRQALIHWDEALVASLKAAAAALRGTGPQPDSSLREAGVAVEAQLDALRRHRDPARAPDASQAARFLARLAATRLLVDTQLQIEAWLAEWHRAQATPPGAGRESEG